MGNANEAWQAMIAAAVLGTERAGAMAVPDVVEGMEWAGAGGDSGLAVAAAMSVYLRAVFRRKRPRIRAGSRPGGWPRTVGCRHGPIADHSSRKPMDAAAGMVRVGAGGRLCESTTGSPGSSAAGGARPDDSCEPGAGSGRARPLAGDAELGMAGPLCEGCGRSCRSVANGDTRATRAASGPGASRESDRRARSDCIHVAAGSAGRSRRLSQVAAHQSERGGRGTARSAGWTIAGRRCVMRHRSCFARCPNLNLPGGCRNGFRG